MVLTPWNKADSFYNEAIRVCGLSDELSVPTLSLSLQWREGREGWGEGGRGGAGRGGWGRQDVQSCSLDST